MATKMMLIATSFAFGFAIVGCGSSSSTQVSPCPSPSPSPISIGAAMSTSEQEEFARAVSSANAKTERTSSRFSHEENTIIGDSAVPTCATANFIWEGKQDPTSRAAEYTLTIKTDLSGTEGDKGTKTENLILGEDRYVKKAQEWTRTSSVPGTWYSVFAEIDWDTLISEATAVRPLEPTTIREVEVIGHELTVPWSILKQADPNMRNEWEMASDSGDTGAPEAVIYLWVDSQGRIVKYGTELELGNVFDSELLSSSTPDTTVNRVFLSSEWWDFGVRLEVPELAN